MITKKFSVDVVSPSDKEYLVAEIWFDDLMIAEINQENGFFEIEIYSLFGKSIKFSLEELLDILAEAKKKLILLK